ncbi:hypothetical protein TNCV_4572161 [Trichonephila clavipes]|nr:hypothetical protein TNCV_4572161 [Trichonephila clavipes]
MYIDAFTGRVIFELDSCCDSDDENEEEIIGSLIQMDFVSKVPKLQYICLQTIQANLLRFNEAVSTTTDANFRMNLRYLWY